MLFFLLKHLLVSSLLWIYLFIFFFLHFILSGVSVFFPLCVFAVLVLSPRPPAVLNWFSWWTNLSSWNVKHGQAGPHKITNLFFWSGRFLEGEDSFFLSFSLSLSVSLSLSLCWIGIGLPCYWQRSHSLRSAILDLYWMLQSAQHLAIIPFRVSEFQTAINESFKSERERERERKRERRGGERYP